MIAKYEPKPFSLVEYKGHCHVLVKINNEEAQMALWPHGDTYESIYLADGLLPKATVRIPKVKFDGLTVLRNWY